MGPTDGLLLGEVACLRDGWARRTCEWGFRPGNGLGSEGGSGGGVGGLGEVGVGGCRWWAGLQRAPFDTMLLLPSPSCLCQMPYRSWVMRSWVMGHGSYLYFSSLRVQHLHQSCLFICLHHPCLGHHQEWGHGFVSHGCVPEEGLAVSCRKVALVQKSQILTQERTASILSTH